MAFMGQLVQWEDQLKAKFATTADGEVSADVGKTLPKNVKVPPPLTDKEESAINEIMILTERIRIIS